MPYAPMLHEVDPKESALKEIGDISEIEVFNNQVLVIIYKRPEKTAKGIYLTDNNRDEDRYQSKVGLIVKLGENAFQDGSGEWFRGITFELGQWVVFKPSDGWAINVRGSDCRMLDDTNVRGRVQHPDMVW